MKQYLERKVSKNTRYYLVKLYKNLFGEFVLERVYGNIAFKRHTGKIIEFFKNRDNAVEKMKKIIKDKQKKGYEFAKS